MEDTWKIHGRYATFEYRTSSSYNRFDIFHMLHVSYDRSKGGREKERNGIFTTTRSLFIDTTREERSTGFILQSERCPNQPSSVICRDIVAVYSISNRQVHDSRTRHIKFHYSKLSIPRAPRSGTNRGGNGECRKHSLFLLFVCINFILSVWFLPIHR